MKKKLKIFSITAVAALVALLLVCDIIVSVNAHGRCYDNVADVPHRNVGLLLGTSPFWGTHYRNIYFENRIDVAANLYNAGRVDTLIVSGGDYTANQGYNEPQAMRDSLMVRGVPEDRIILDYDGTRTLKSIVKVRDVYHTDSVTIISQGYHNERAIYQADHIGIDAIAVEAPTPRNFVKLVKNRGREYFARVKLFIDLWLGEDPKFE